MYLANAVSSQCIWGAVSLGVNDMVVDIGSGDGVVLREAARYGAWRSGMS